MLSEDPTDEKHDVLLAAFHGRVREIHMLSRLLEAPEPRFAFVLGSRGTGKTALCRFYAHQRREHYDATLWVCAHSFYDVESLLVYIYSEIGKALGIRIPSTGRSRRAVEQQLANRRILVILDDFDALSHVMLSQLVRRLIPLPKQVRVVMCGRSLAGLEDIQAKLAARSVHLGPLSNADAWNIVKKRLQWAKIDEKRTENFLRKLQSFGIHRFSLSPRLLLEFLNDFLRTSDFYRALERSVGDYFASYTSLLVVAEEERLLALPATLIEPHQIITPKWLYIPTAPYIVIPSLRHVWQGQLEEFEELLNDPRVSESALQTFFERNPYFLKGIDYRALLTHPVLERDHEGGLIPDFFLQPLGSDLADILDLKLPRTDLIVDKRNRLRFSQAVADGIAQLREYRDYFEDPKYRERVKKRYGITAYRPTTILVIGRTQPAVPQEKLKQLMESCPPYTKIVTYDDLHLRMRRMLESDIR